MGNMLTWQEEKMKHSLFIKTLKTFVHLYPNASLRRDREHMNNK